MTSILHINSSVRTQGSISRQLSAEFLAKWKIVQPFDRVVERDLASSSIPHLSEQLMAAFFTPREQRSPAQADIIRLSDELVAELLAADVIVIGAPMYNFSVSSALKAWIDHVTRAGVTFKYTDTGPVGLVSGKKVYVFTASGGVYSDGPDKAMDFHGTYLRAVLGFIGLSDITFVASEGLGMGEDAAASAIAQSRRSMAALVAA